MPFKMVQRVFVAEDINLSIKCRYSSRILRFELLILKDAFLRVIFAFLFGGVIDLGCGGNRSLAERGLWAKGRDQDSPPQCWQATLRVGGQCWRRWDGLGEGF
jgi:hypothetical protein